MLLAELKSQRLSSVEFVQDYIQLHFDDYTLTLYNPVKIAHGPVTLRQDQTGFKDALCDFINLVVHDVFQVNGDKVEVVFDSAASVVVSITDRDYSGPEALQLCSRDSKAPILVL